MFSERLVSIAPPARTDDPDAPPSYLPTEPTNPRFNAQAKKNKNFRPDIHIILIDSCSSTLARRAIPQTLTFLEQKMGGVFMHHLNRVADNSHPNGALNRILGVDKEFEKERLANCMEEWHALLKYHGQFAAGYKNNPKFGLSWLVSLLHGNANMLYHTDDYFLKYFQEHEKTFDNSFVFFMGDHGPRIGPTTGTEMGQREVNNPMLMLMVPKFLRENKELMTNLKAHSTSLLTHFDVYATLQDILKNAHATNYTSFKYEQILNPNPNNGTSILRPRGPFEDRNCQNVPVTGDYCLCEFNKTEKNFVPMGKFAVELINEYVEQEMLTDLCAPLSLGKSSPPERWSLYLAQMPTLHLSYEGKKKPAELPLVTFKQFQKLPLDLWVLVRNALTPADLLCLADADRFFKAVLLPPVAIVPSSTVSGAKPLTIVKPKAESEKAADILITFEQFAEMPQDVWLLLMEHFSPIDMLNLAYADDFFKGLITASPKRWASFVEHTSSGYGELDAKYRPESCTEMVFCRTYALSRSQKRWEAERKYLLAYGNEYTYPREVFGDPPFEDGLCRHVPPDVGTKYSSYKYVLDTKLLKDFHRIVVPALNTLIDQWERREREIDYITFNAQESPQPGRHYRMWNNFRELHPDILLLPKELCEKRTDPIRLYDLDRLALIRRGPESHEGLLIGVYGASIVLLACDYNFRRQRTCDELNKFLRDAYDFSRQMPRTRASNRAAAGNNPRELKYQCETLVKKWTKMEPYNTMHDREMIVDQAAANWQYNVWPFPATEIGVSNEDPILHAYQTQNGHFYEDEMIMEMSSSDSDDSF
ncbi:unnamed protein product, partial [Mesorhabditis spiculigera]